MKRYEKESLLKNFLVFFSLLMSLLVLLFIELYHTHTREYKQNIYKTMQVCSYTMECPEFKYDFIDKDKSKLNELHENLGLHSYFTIPKSEKFYLKISYAQSKYLADIQDLKQDLALKFFLALLLLFLMALFFTFYSLQPIRKALQINDEFIKDILHDFNTPITSMILNIKMYTEEKGDDIFIKRIAQGINSIKLLQNNLKSFLHHSPSQNRQVDVAHLLKERLDVMKNTYPKLHFYYEKRAECICLSNEEILTRIFDNLLSNAAKYNKPTGAVYVTINQMQINIKDTGKGIENIDKVTQRYYTEQERGIGLGLHIVQKLVNELNIEMKIISKVGIGTTFILDFKNSEEGLL